MTELLWEQKLKVASVRKVLIDAIAASGEKDIAILLAALVETIGTVSDWNLEAERNQARGN